jgi:hypothetical protein
MDKSYIKENAKSRERLAKLVKSLTDDDLKLVIYKEGWTIAAALGHIAFWDERRRFMLKLWKKKGVSAAPRFGLMINDILLPLLLAIPPRKAAELVVATAAALDKEIEALPPTMVKDIVALKDDAALNRAAHRNDHLDEIDAFLKKQGKVR